MLHTRPRLCSTGQVHKLKKTENIIINHLGKEVVDEVVKIEQRTR